MYPFTPSQWQELEQQALIYKYMVSGIPIPSDLIVPIRRSFLLDYTRTSPTLAFPPPTPLGWNCFQAGFGRKAEDPEPGRCRRTDGKKWRCSKEAYPDSKYCERHMHRGKNRSRKPVEISLATSTYPSSSSSAHYPITVNHQVSAPDYCELLYPYSSASKSSNLQLDSTFYLEGDYRYGQGMKNSERNIIFSDGTGYERESSLQLKPLGIMSSMAEASKRNYTLSKEEEEERKRPLRRFFDESPQKNKDSWLELEEENSSYTKTQLSISFPK